MASTTKPYCLAPWTSLVILPNGWVSPCHVSKSADNKDVFGDLKKSSFRDIWTSNKAIRFRELHRQNPFTAHECSLCIAYEKQSFPSRRDEIDERFRSQIKHGDLNTDNLLDPKDIFFLDISFSNICNFTCSMCSSAYSTSWVELEKKIGSEFSERVLHDNNYGFEDATKNLESIFPYLRNLQQLIIKGGEPFLSKQCLWFLEKLIELDVAPQVQLIVITNGSIYNPKICQILNHFNAIDIVVSLDAVGDLYEYIRGPKSSFAKVNTNIELFKKISPNTSVIISPTLQSYNALRIFELVKFSFNLTKNVHFKNWVIEPSYQSIVSLPQELIPQACEELEKSICFLNEKSPNNISIRYLKCFIDYLQGHVPRLKNHDIKENHFEKLQRFTRYMDKDREKNICDIIPEFRGYLDVQ